jgi:uncharacterized membrane protein YqaE (UPF0057 family)
MTICNYFLPLNYIVMKFKSLLQFVVVMLAGQFLFSCSSGEYYRFTSAKPESYQKAIAKTDPAAAPGNVVSPLAETTELEPVAEPVLEANAGTSAPVLFETKKAATPIKAAAPTKPEVTLDEKSALESATATMANMTKAEKKEFKKEFKNEFRKAYRDTQDAELALLVVLAILLPPLAVFLHEGIGSRFWISVLLTLLFFLPGIIYALLVVTDTI